MIKDATTTMAELKAIVEDFVRERAWQKFHKPKSLAMSVAIEAAELMECFQWQTDAEAERAMKKLPLKKMVADELADVVIYCLALANRTGIDLSRAVTQKVAKNRQKYPASVFKGRYEV